MNKKIKYKGFVRTQDFDRLAACHASGPTGARNYPDLRGVRVLHLLHPSIRIARKARSGGGVVPPPFYRFCAQLNDASAPLSYERLFSPRPNGPRRPW